MLIVSLRRALSVSDFKSQAAPPRLWRAPGRQRQVSLQRSRNFRDVLRRRIVKLTGEGLDPDIREKSACGGGIRGPRRAQYSTHEIGQIAKAVDDMGKPAPAVECVTEYNDRGTDQQRLRPRLRIHRNNRARLPDDFIVVRPRINQDHIIAARQQLPNPAVVDRPDQRRMLLDRQLPRMWRSEEHTPEL